MDEVTMEEMIAAEIDLGLKVEEFRRSDVYAYLAGCAAQEVERTRQELMGLSMQGGDFLERFAETRMRCGAAELFMEWLDEALSNAQNAYQLATTGEIE